MSAESLLGGLRLFVLGVFALFAVLVVFVRGLLGGLGGLFAGGFGLVRLGLGDAGALELEGGAGVIASNSLLAGFAAGIGEFFFVFL